MSDTRFTMIGIGLIFVGFVVLGIFGSQYYDSTVEALEFGDCYEYFEDRSPIPVDCNIQLQNKSLFSAMVFGFIGGGIISLIRGVKGKWDQDVKPEDMVGPGGSDSSRFGKKDSEENNSEETESDKTDNNK